MKIEAFGRKVTRAKGTALVLVSSLLILLFSIVVMVCLDRIARFKNSLRVESDKIGAIIRDDVKKFEYGLQGARGAFIADRLQFNPEIFRKYSESRGAFRNFRGALGFGFIRAVQPADLDQYEKRMQKGRPDFKVHPRTSSSLHMVIELIEPVSVNSAALGLDVSFEEHRRSSALFSARTGQVALTNRVELVQRQGRGNGFLFYMPVYREPIEYANDQERLENLLGWVYAPIFAETLLADIASKIPEQIGINIRFDDHSPTLPLGTRVQKSRFVDNEARLTLEFGDKKWEIVVSEDATDVEFFLFVMAGISVLLALGGFYGTRKMIHFARGRDELIEQNSKLLDAAVNSAAHMVIATDPAGKITAVNRAAVRILEYSEAELISRTPELFHNKEEVILRATELSRELGESIEPGFRTFVAKCEKHGFDTNEWSYVSKSGRRIPIRLTVTAIRNSANEISGFLGVAEDLTEHNEMLAVIEAQRAKMTQDAKMATLGEMAGGIAHEINTPLATILGTTETIRYSVENGVVNTELTLTQLKRIESTTQRIATIIRGLRSFSRSAESDPMVIVPIANIVNNTLELCRERFKSHSITISVDVPTELSVACREVQLSQILMNLLSNSFDAIADHSERRIEISASRIGDLVQILVSDSGRGVQPENVDRIMRPFFTTKPIGAGTGLGLSVSLGLARAHNGDLKLVSERGPTTFALELPAA